MTVAYWCVRRSFPLLLLHNFLAYSVLQSGAPWGLYPHFFYYRPSPIRQNSRQHAGEAVYRRRGRRLVAEVSPRPPALVDRPDYTRSCGWNLTGLFRHRWAKKGTSSGASGFRGHGPASTALRAWPGSILLRRGRCPVPV